MMVLGAGSLIGCTTEDGRGSGGQDSGVLSLGGGSESTDGSATHDGADESGGTGDDGTESGSASMSESGPANDTGELKFDLGVQPDAEQPQSGEGCKKVDLLFVIDNSGSMADEQDNLAASFPNFINGIQTTLAGAESYHVAAITTDAYAGNPTTPINCRVLGAFITQTAGTDSSNQVCTPFANGLRFMTDADDLTAKFTCAAKPGSDGNGDERTMDAVRAALSPGLQAGGACNEGFLRDDALLVLVFITDEEDDHEQVLGIPVGGSAGDPPDWFQDIVARKAGIEQNIVVLSLVGTPKPNACPANQWDGFNGAEIATRIIQFTNMFTYGFVGDVCADNYGPFFDEAISVIDTACDNFEPPG